MEEFIGQENKYIYEALVSGNFNVEWPVICRNCDWCYSESLKRKVTDQLLKNPMKDILRIVSDGFKEELPESMKVRYCCINNFRPRIERRFGDTYENLENSHTRYRVYSETLIIEEGLAEWYDVNWLVDDVDVLVETEKEVIRPPVSFANPKTSYELDLDQGQVTLFNLIEQSVM